MGLPNLSGKDQERVPVGNLLLKASCGLMRLGRRMMLPCTLENPHTSRAWITPPMSAIIRLPGCSDALTQFCMYGKPWRKST
eukprot:776240-Heterocapsa_arctica.AAC.1